MHFFRDFLLKDPFRVFDPFSGGPQPPESFPILLFFGSLFFIMENCIYFRVGEKSFDITETIMYSETWFEWVENTRYYTRRMTLSKGALGWLCRRLREASEVRGKMFKTWRGRDVSTNIFCSLKFNKFGRFLSIITVNGQKRQVIIVPENKDNEGWMGLPFSFEDSILCSCKMM